MEFLKLAGNGEIRKQKQKEENQNEEKEYLEGNHLYRDCLCKL